MIQEVTMYTVVCDNCKKSAGENSEYAAWSDESSAKDVAMDSGYITEGKKHYCSDCFFYGDNDELIIKQLNK